MFNLTLSHLPTRYNLITNTPGRNQAALPLWTKLRTTLSIRIPHVVKWTFSRKLIQLLRLLSCLYLACDWPVAVLGASEECSVKPSLPLGSYALNQWAKQTKTRERVKSYSCFTPVRHFRTERCLAGYLQAFMCPAELAAGMGILHHCKPKLLLLAWDKGEGGLRSGPGSPLLPGCSLTCRWPAETKRPEREAIPLEEGDVWRTTPTQCMRWWDHSYTVCVTPSTTTFYRKLGLHSKTPSMSSLVDVPDTGWCRSFIGVRGSPIYLLSHALYGKVGGILATRSCVLPAYAERQGSMRRKRWNDIVEKEMILGTKHFLQGRRTRFLFLFMFS